MTGDLRIFQAQRHGQVPVGTSALALSQNPQDLQFAVDYGNRATRRQAKRKLTRMQKRGAV